MMLNSYIETQDKHQLDQIAASRCCKNTAKHNICRIYAAKYGTIFECSRDIHRLPVNDQTCNNILGKSTGGKN